MTQTQLSQLLATLRRELARTLGDQMQAVILYGSRARGEASPDADIDVLIVLQGDFDYGDMLKRTSPIISTLSLDNEVVISRAFISAERYQRERSPFILNVRREGVPV